MFNTDSVNLSLDIYFFYPKDLMINYAIRFLIFMIPATITIFTFVYKEKKEVSYSNIKTSNIIYWFLCTICLEILALFFSITTATEFPRIEDAPLIGQPYHHYQMSILFTMSAIFALFLYTYFLFVHMDIHYSIKTTFNKNVKLHKRLKYYFRNEKIKNHNISYNNLFESYNYMLESNFQLVISAISKKNLSNVQDDVKKLFALTKDFYLTFIDISSLENLIKLFKITDDDILHLRVLKALKETFSIEETNQEELKKSINYQEKLIEVYKSILYGYKLLIREASKNHISEIQKLAYIELSSLNPIKVFKFNINNLDDESFVLVNNYYQSLAECYHDALFEMIKEFSDEKSVEYSYLLNQITSSTEFFEALNLAESVDSEHQEIFYTSFVNKEISLIEALLVRAVEIDNIRFLTESTRLLLDLFYSHVKKPRDIQKAISKKLRKGNRIFDMYVSLSNSSKKNSQEPNGKYRQLIVSSIIRTILHALYKSIELNKYGCSGYIIKVSVSHITMKNYLQEIKDFIQIIIERENLIFNLDYYHYSFNSYSKIHCVQKMVLLLAFQFIYRYGNVHKNDLHDLVKIVFLENKNDLGYMLEKIDAASKSYGMISLSDDKTQKLIESIIQPAVKVN